MSLLEKLKKDYPDLTFKEGEKFAFRPPRTIVLGPPEPFWELLALHEVSHAILDHRVFKMDVTRLRMEKAAWEKAKELAETYRVEINDDFIQDGLDTYRNWLHSKSRCSACGLTRFQTPDGEYHCPRCDELLK